MKSNLQYLVLSLSVAVALTSACSAKKSSGVVVVNNTTTKSQSDVEKMADALASQLALKGYSESEVKVIRQAAVDEANAAGFSLLGFYAAPTETEIAEALAAGAMKGVALASPQSDKVTAVPGDILSAMFNIMSTSAKAMTGTEVASLQGRITKSVVKGFKDAKIPATAIKDALGNVAQMALGSAGDGGAKDEDAALVAEAIATSLISGLELSGAPTEDLPDISEVVAKKAMEGLKSYNLGAEMVTVLSDAFIAGTMVGFKASSVPEDIKMKAAGGVTSGLVVGFGQLLPPENIPELVKGVGTKFISSMENSGISKENFVSMAEKVSEGIGKGAGKLPFEATVIESSIQGGSQGLMMGMGNLPIQVDDMTTWHEKVTSGIATGMKRADVPPAIAAAAGASAVKGIMAGTEIAIKAMPNGGEAAYQAKADAFANNLATKMTQGLVSTGFDQKIIDEKSTVILQSAQAMLPPPPPGGTVSSGGSLPPPTGTSGPIPSGTSAPSGGMISGSPDLMGSSISEGAWTYNTNTGKLLMGVHLVVPMGQVLNFNTVSVRVKKIVDNGAGCSPTGIGSVTADDFVTLSNVHFAGLPSGTMPTTFNDNLIGSYSLSYSTCAYLQLTVLRVQDSVGKVTVFGQDPAYPTKYRKSTDGGTTWTPTTQSIISWSSSGGGGGSGSTSNTSTSNTSTQSSAGSIPNFAEVGVASSIAGTITNGSVPVSISIDYTWPNLASNRVKVAVKAAVDGASNCQALLDQTNTPITWHDVSNLSCAGGYGGPAGGKRCDGTINLNVTNCVRYKPLGVQFDDGTTMWKFVESSTTGNCTWGGTGNLFDRYSAPYVSSGTPNWQAMSIGGCTNSQVSVAPSNLSGGGSGGGGGGSSEPNFGGVGRDSSAGSSLSNGQVPVTVYVNYTSPSIVTSRINVAVKANVDGASNCQTLDEQATSVQWLTLNNPQCSGGHGGPAGGYFCNGTLNLSASSCARYKPLGVIVDDGTTMWRYIEGATTGNCSWGGTGNLFEKSSAPYVSSGTPNWSTPVNTGCTNSQTYSAQ